MQMCVHSILDLRHKFGRNKVYPNPTFNETGRKGSGTTMPLSDVLSQFQDIKGSSDRSRLCFNRNHRVPEPNPGSNEASAAPATSVRCGFRIHESATHPRPPRDSKRLGFRHFGVSPLCRFANGGNRYLPGEVLSLPAFGG